ncbi:hypothetical protein PI125_g8193 [Phytophthora idaei]|nr:hypothetical protein PI125_g8193 [Phytophthora idaei]KAG3146184.1 hypothetical protein PI126_g13430 [Phytophthora idaei]
MDFVFGLPHDAQGRTGILVFVDRFSKMVHLAPVAGSITTVQTAAIFVDTVYRHRGLPTSIVSDRDPRFTAAFWSGLFKSLGTRLLMSTAAQPKTDGQTEHGNRVLGDVLRSYATSFTSCSSFLPTVEFALNNAEHASTGLTPFYVNYGRHPRVPAPSVWSAHSRTRSMIMLMRTRPRPRLTARGPTCLGQLAMRSNIPVMMTVRTLTTFLPRY